MLTNNHKKLVKSLHQKKYRDEHGLFIVEGEKLVSELLVSDFVVDSLFALPRVTENFTEATEVSEKEMSQMSQLKNPSPVMAIAVKPKSAPVSQNADCCIILDNIKDPGNLGTIIRTAEWFGMSELLVSPETVDQFNSKVVQASMGSLFRTNILRLDLNEAINSLKEQGHLIYTAHMEGENFRQIKWPKKKALIIGNESHGLSPVYKTSEFNTVSIPKIGGAESLNAAMASGIIISSWFK